MELAKVLREATLSDVRKSYEDLKEAKAKNPDFRRMGLVALDYFFLHHRIKARTRAHISFYEAMRNSTRKKHLNELVVRYRKKPLRSYSPNHLLRAEYGAFQLYYGTINQFRPIVAKWVYQTFQPKRIVDFSAGWGGRCMAAMSMGIPYVGVDANTKLKVSYRRMIETLEPDAEVTMLFQPAETVDWSQWKYDLVFTSPPYFMLEEYEKMPVYQSKQNFLDRFFVPVILAVWKYLSREGHLALNMPEEMYLAIKDHLPRLKRKIKLPISNRHPKNASRKTKLGTTNTERFELIYVWKKS